MYVLDPGSATGYILHTPALEMHRHCILMREPLTSFMSINLRSMFFISGHRCSTGGGATAV